MGLYRVEVWTVTTEYLTLHRRMYFYFILVEMYTENGRSISNKILNASLCVNQISETGGLVKTFLICLNIMSNKQAFLLL